MDDGDNVTPIRRRPKVQPKDRKAPDRRKKRPAPPSREPKPPRLPQIGPVMAGEVSGPPPPTTMPRLDYREFMIPEGDAAPVKTAVKMIRNRLPWLVGKLFELAEGVWVEDPMTGAVYKSKPDVKALMYLMDRILGKPGRPVGLLDAVAELARQNNLSPEQTAKLLARADAHMRGVEYRERREIAAGRGE